MITRRKAWLNGHLEWFDNTERCGSQKSFEKLGWKGEQEHHPAVVLSQSWLEQLAAQG